MVLASGLYRELLSSCAPFSAYVASFQEQAQGMDDEEGSTPSAVELSDGGPKDALMENPTDASKKSETAGEAGLPEQVISKEATGTGVLRFDVLQRYIKMGGYGQCVLAMIILVASFLVRRKKKSGSYS